MAAEVPSPSHTVGTIARLLLLSERRVQQLSKEGVIPKNQHGRYELVPVVQAYVRFLQDRAMGRQGPDDYHKEKARLIKLQADRAQLDLDQMESRLVQAEDVVQAWENVLQAFKSKLLAIPTKAAPVIASETVPGQVQQILEDLIGETLAELANYDPTIDPAGTAESPPEDSA